MGKSFEELIYGGRMQPSTFGRSPSRMQEPATEESNSGLASKRGYERAINQRLAKQELVDAELLERFGTTDLDDIGGLKGTGLFTEKGILPAGEIARLMALDPIGTRAAVDRAVSISGMNGARALTGSPDTSQYYEGVGRSGERFFTNRTPQELSTPTPGDMDIREDVTDLKEINPLLMGGGGNVGGGNAASPERMAFEGQLAQAMGIAEKPERDKAKRQKAMSFMDSIITRASTETDVRTELARLKDPKVLAAAGVEIEDAAKIEKDLIRRAKDPAESAKAIALGVPPEYALPWKRPGKDGQAADPASPASVLNPGGGPPVITKAQQKEVLTSADNMNLIEEGLGREVPRTNHYAKGGKAPKTRSSFDRGGRGGSLLGDIGAFTEGEGRFGYGEEGPIGMIKDIGAFYGPRLPGDIFAATLGGGTGKAAIKGASQLRKLRSVENMFGLF